MKVIDATNLIAGRIATKVAKMALLGEEVAIINADKAVMTGNKQNILAKYNRIAEIGVPKKGPFLHRMPDRLLRRIIRGMLPYKTTKGSDALSRIKCYVGTPEFLKDAETITFEEANVSKLPTLKYIDIATISRNLGAKL